MSSYLLLVLFSIIQVFQANAEDVYKQSFTFSDQTQFADLSVYNFDKGLTYTYQYSITARPNRQVSIHFLTNLMKNANVVLYNGADATAPKVDISSLYKIDQSGSEVVPVVLTSTGRSFYLEVTPLTTNAGLKQDFQALATDIVQPAKCGALVRAANFNGYILQIFLDAAPEGCIHILRTVDMANNKYARFSIDWLDTDATTLIYKGLSMKPESKLVTLERENSYNEKNIIIQHNHGMTIQFGYVIYENPTGDLVVSNPINSKQTTMFVTADYLPPRPIGANEVTKNGFYFQGMFQVDTLKINFLSGIGTGNLVITYMKFQQANKTVSYTNANLPKSLTIKESDADDFQLNYSCTGAACTGMYGTVEDVTIPDPNAPTGRPRYTPSGNNGSTARPNSTATVSAPTNKPTTKLGGNNGGTVGPNITTSASASTNKPTKKFGGNNGGTVGQNNTTSATNNTTTASAPTNKPKTQPGGNNGFTVGPNNTTSGTNNTTPGKQNNTGDHNNGDNNGGKKDNAAPSLISFLTIPLFIMFFKL